MKHAVLVLLPSLLLAACNKPEPPPPAPRPVVVVNAGDEAGHGLRLYSGEVRARHEVDIGFRVGGKIVERKVSAGEAVKRGQLLARLDAQDLRLSDNAARAAVAAAEADVTLARAEFQRAETLVSQRFVSASALDSRRNQLQAAEARLRQVQAQAGVQGNQVSYSALLADRDGVIVAAPAEAGQVVAAGQVVVRLADPREREILIWVPETRIAQVKVGQPAFVRPWNAQERTLPGSVREVAAAADTTTRTYAVRIAVPGADDSLPLGATAGVGFPVEEKVAIALPLPAVQRAAGGAGSTGPTHVWVVGADDIAQPRKVEVAAWRDELAVIASGVQPGERVVVVGAHALTAGEKVRPVAQSAPVALDVKR
ncbi:MAG: efflux RND transporter periplasmic adaptor subunit [Moraxellaceae bacterium]|nr:efflux RND transporter periplasmic adaptor subunit [Moraxellaceae bacterium]